MMRQGEPGGQQCQRGDAGDDVVVAALQADPGAAGGGAVVLGAAQFRHSAAPASQCTPPLGGSGQRASDGGGGAQVGEFRRIGGAGGGIGGADAGRVVWVTCQTPGRVRCVGRWRGRGVLVQLHGLRLAVRDR